MSLEEFLSEWNNDSPFIEVKTSGSTGEPKRMLVEKRRMLASARIKPYSVCHSTISLAR